MTPTKLVRLRLGHGSKIIIHISIFGALSLIGKAVVLKTTSNRDERCVGSSPAGSAKITGHLSCFIPVVNLLSKCPLDNKVCYKTLQKNECAGMLHL